jgi:hypothetical protein
MSDAAPPAAVGPRSHGQWAVVAMLVLAVILATFAWLWNFDRGRRTLELFGPEGAMLIRTAPYVQVVLKPEDAIDISSAPGLLNARTSLLDDASYEWEASSSQFKTPQYHVEFRRETRREIQIVEVYFDFENSSIYVSSTRRTAKLKKKTADGWRAYLERQVKAK